MNRRLGVSVEPSSSSQMDISLRLPIESPNNDNDKGINNRDTTTVIVTLDIAFPRGYPMKEEAIARCTSLKFIPGQESLFHNQLTAYLAETCGDGIGGTGIAAASYVQENVAKFLSWKKTKLQTTISRQQPGVSTAGAITTTRPQQQHHYFYYVKFHHMLLGKEHKKEKMVKQILSSYNFDYTYWFMGKPSVMIIHVVEEAGGGEDAHGNDDLFAKSTANSNIITEFLNECSKKAGKKGELTYSDEFTLSFNRDDNDGIETKKKKKGTIEEYGYAGANNSESLDRDTLLQTIVSIQQMSRSRKRSDDSSCSRGSSSGKKSSNNAQQHQSKQQEEEEYNDEATKLLKMILL